MSSKKDVYSLGEKLSLAPRQVGCGHAREWLRKAEYCELCCLLLRFPKLQETLRVGV